MCGWEIGLLRNVVHTVRNCFIGIVSLPGWNLIHPVVVYLEGSTAIVPFVIRPSSLTQILNKIEMIFLNLLQIIDRG
jgi:hypothetical protein